MFQVSFNCFTTYSTGTIFYFPAMFKSLLLLEKFKVQSSHTIQTQYVMTYFSPDSKNERLELLSKLKLYQDSPGEM